MNLKMIFSTNYIREDKIFYKFSCDSIDCDLKCNSTKLFRSHQKQHQIGEKKGS